MKLSNGKHAVVDVRGKLVGYCLSISHRTGRHKARMFRSVLGVDADDAELLAAALRTAARNSDAKLKDKSDDAAKYEIEFPMTGPLGTAMVRSGWIIERGSDIRRLTSCYVRLGASGGSNG